SGAGVEGQVSPRRPPHYTPRSPHEPRKRPAADRLENLSEPRQLERVHVAPVPHHERAVSLADHLVKSQRYASHLCLQRSLGPKYSRSEHATAGPPAAR